MEVTVFKYGNFHIGGVNHLPFNFLAVQVGQKIDIIREPITVGIYTFEPGVVYTKFGSAKKRSSGYARFEVKPGSNDGLYFEGSVINSEGDTFILFTKFINGEVIKSKPPEPQYSDIYICFQVMELDALFYINAAGGGRVIEMGDDSKVKERPLRGA